MAFETIRFDAEGEVARLTLARPPLNVLNIQMLAEIRQAFGRIAPRRDLKALVITGEGKAFSAGVDVADHLGEKIRPMIENFHGLFLEMLELPCPVVVGTHGATLGGGCELATMADVLICAESTQIGQPEIRLGLFPPVACVAFPGLVGPQRALELLLTGRVLTAGEAERIGLCNRVVPDADLAGAIDEVVASLREKSAAALRLTRRATLEAIAPDFRERLRRVEALYLDELMRTEDALEGLHAFIEKRAPTWKNA